MANSSFGIDIGEKYTRIVDLSYDNGKINLFKYGDGKHGTKFFSDDTEKSIENQSEVIAKLCSDLKIIKKKVSIIIPDSQSFSQILEFAKLNEKNFFPQFGTKRISLSLCP